MGYEVVYTEELRSCRRHGQGVGDFAASDTYNDTTEEANAEERWTTMGNR